ncbi:leucyl/phenylalanyl-tRNA--protein transferase [Melaminivora sp.]
MTLPLPWIGADEPLPPTEQAWSEDSPAPGLLAAGGCLTVPRLRQAYAQGCFPWYSQGQPILWWSPQPRMVLPVAQFRLHRSLKKNLLRFRTQPGCEVRVDSAFGRVIRACAQTPRPGQSGSWIMPEMIEAYEALHAAGLAHSVETWVDGQLLGGLYCVALGRALFGESMFAHATDASKIALAALVCIARRQGVELIDCQQNTHHLASLGAHEIQRGRFLAHVRQASSQPAIAWGFSCLYWDELLPPIAA